jgi:hypothetical protein
LLLLAAANIGYWHYNYSRHAEWSSSATLPWQARFAERLRSSYGPNPDCGPADRILHLRNPMSLTTHPAAIDWLAKSSLAHSFNEADPWTFATFMTIHLLGLALAFGTSLILNLRLVGLGLRASQPAQIARNLQPYLLAGLSIALLSGRGCSLQTY